MATMKTITGVLRLLDLGSYPDPLRIGKSQRGPASLLGAGRERKIVMNAYRTLAVLALGTGWANAQTPACAYPGCNSVTSDTDFNTATGTGALSNIVPPAMSNFNGDSNTASGYQALYTTTTGSTNTAVGYRALYSNTIGGRNTALGASALFSNVAGLDNTAIGTFALTSNAGGINNTASGSYALQSNTSGGNNTASGVDALYSNTSGNFNTASGTEALYLNTTGNSNTASGVDALYSNTTGSGNTGSGSSALYNNQGGLNNSAFGSSALQGNTIGNGNVAQGLEALYKNTDGNRNTAIGNYALYANLHGSYNLALGFNAARNLTAGTDDIYIANVGVTGESQTLRLGTEGTSGVAGSGILSAYVAGVATSQVTGSAVYVSASGQLGVLPSSERYKTDVQPIGSASDRLAELRPVTYKLKNDPQGAVQYGLIAEEVVKVYPELVIRDNSGKIQGVRYEELTPILLKEVQQQAEEIRELKKLVLEMQAGRPTSP
jgi:trimeric autotransporter adhesin